MRTMIIGVISDTHGNLNLMRQVVRTIQNDYRAEVLFHLGDDYADADELVYSGNDVRRIPGLWCPAYQDGAPRQLTDTFDGLRIACAHADRDLRHTERSAAVVLLGHTHTASVELLGRSLYVNPGHLKSPISRGERASFALINIRPDDVCVQIYEALDNLLRFQVVVERARLG